MGLSSTRTLLCIVLVLNITLGVARGQCPYGIRAPRAVIGRGFNLTCRADCSDSVYRWQRKEDGIWEDIDGITTKILNITQNVTSAASIGGEEYKCECSDSCQRFIIGVMPVATLKTSQPAVGTGRSANVTCFGESYPMTNVSSNYLFKHPRNSDIDKVLLPTKDGVVHIIDRANKHDDGEYDCTVLVNFKEYGIPLQSDIATINLTVYDPPRISKSSNYTIAEAGQKALLGCTVDNIEGDRLGVWVEWYDTVTMNPLTEEHENFTLGDVYYLLIYNASEKDYTCLLFSTYSPITPEDEKTVSVKIKEVPTASPPSTSPPTEDNKSDVTVTILSVFLALMSILSLILITGIIVYIIMKKRHAKKYSVEEEHNSANSTNTTQRNDYVNINTLASPSPSHLSDSTNETESGPIAITTDGSHSSTVESKITVEEQKAHIESDGKRSSITPNTPMPEIPESKTGKSVVDDTEHPTSSKPQTSVTEPNKPEKGSIKGDGGSFLRNRSLSSLQGSQRRSSIPRHLAALTRQSSRPKSDEDKEQRVSLLLEETEFHFTIGEENDHTP